MILIMLPSLFDSLQSLPGRWQRIEVGGILFSRSEPVRSMYCLQEDIQTASVAVQR